MRALLISILVLCAGSLAYAANQQQSNAALYGHYLKGLFHLKQGDYEAGLKELQQAKDDDPDSVHARLKIATILIRLGRTDEAEAVLLEAKILDPDNLEISLALIFIYSYAKKDKALEDEYEKLLTRAYELKPDDRTIAEYLGQFYFYKKNSKAAISIYEDIIAKNPEHPDAYFWLGYLLSEDNQSKQAIETWQKGLSIDPNHAQMLNSLGYTYAEKGIKLNGAEKMIKQALLEDPDNGAYLDSLGWVYYKKGDYKKALGYLEKAIEKVKDPEIYLHLGDTCIALNDCQSALVWYRQGIQYFPQDKTLNERIETHERACTSNKK